MNKKYADRSNVENTESPRSKKEKQVPCLGFEKINKQIVKKKIRGVTET